MNLLRKKETLMRENEDISNILQLRESYILTNRNASKTIAGFNYQEMVGLIVFFDNLKEATEVNIEGQDDIDLLFEDGTVSYYQVKETSDPSRSGLKQFEKALNTLDDDLLSGNEIKYLVYVSNSYRPLGGANIKDELFLRDEGLYRYEDLRKELKDKIDSQSGKHTCVNEKEKFRIMKIAYSGADAKTKEKVYNDCIKEFAGKAGLTNTFFFRERMKSIAQNIAENPQEKLTKKRLCLTAEVCEILNTKRIDDFFDDCEISPINHPYIEDKYEDFCDMNFDFECSSMIQKRYMEFISKNKNMKSTEIKSSFIKEQIKILEKEILGEEDNSQQEDVFKLLVWNVIGSIGLEKKIRKAANYHENQ